MRNDGSLCSFGAEGREENNDEGEGIGATMPSERHWEGRLTDKEEKPELIKLLVCKSICQLNHTFNYRSSEK